MKLEPDIRVLVIDDSAANRRAISALLEQAPGVTVVDRAGDGEEGLKKALTLRPDVITLDLEMPRLDGYSFLRLLMARQPTPVIVMSSYGHPSDVFRAMQLGAVDFIAKPAGADQRGFDEVRVELLQKIRAVRGVRKPLPKPSPPRLHTPGLPQRAVVPQPKRPHLLLIGASTGGPPAVQKVLEGLGSQPVVVLVAQHMPARFTDAFAERLNQILPMRVTEAKDGDSLEAGRIYIAPGGAQLEVVEADGRFFASVLSASPFDKYAPSVDRLFMSAARLGPGLVSAVVLTGMGNDGAAGVKALAKEKARIWAEAESTAIIFGMPEAAIATGFVQHVLPLPELGPSIARSLSNTTR